MIDLLAPSQAPAVRALAADGTLVVLDFDGTLAPIVERRDAARLTRRSRRALSALAASLPVAVLSGRAVSDVAARLDGVPVRWVIGSHGAEWPGDGGRHRAWRAQVARWRGAVGARLAGRPGIEIEDKGLSLAVHYRAATSAGAARRAVERAVADLPGARAIAGKRVVNLVPADAGDKGTALRRLVREAGAARLLFVGDDVTDEAAFAADVGVPSVMARVGRSRTSRATHFLGRRADVDELLERLAWLAGPRPAGARGPGDALGPVLDFMRDLWALGQGLERRSKAMQARHGVTGPQRLLVRVVGQLGPVSQAELARVLHLHRSSVTRLVRRLERRRLVRRVPRPGQPGRQLVELSEGGRRVERLRSGTIEGAVRAALGAVSPEDARAAARVLEEVTRRLQRGA